MYQKDVVEVGKYGSIETEVKGDLNLEETNPTVITTVDAKDKQGVDLEKLGNVESSIAKEEKDKQTIGENDAKLNDETVDLAPPVNPVTKSSSLVPPRDEKNRTVLVNGQSKICLCLLFMHSGSYISLG